LTWTYQNKFTCNLILQYTSYGHHHPSDMHIQSSEKKMHLIHFYNSDPIHFNDLLSFSVYIFTTSPLYYQLLPAGKFLCDPFLTFLSFTSATATFTFYVEDFTAQREDCARVAGANTSNMRCVQVAH